MAHPYQQFNEMTEWTQYCAEHPRLTFVDLNVIFKKKHRIDLYDVYRSGKHFDKWHKAKELPKLDPDGNPLASSQIWFREYEEDPEGSASRPPYFNFWHWLLEWSKANGDAQEITISANLVIPGEIFDERRKSEIYNNLIVAAQQPVETLPPSFYTAIGDMIRDREAMSAGVQKITSQILADFHGPVTITW